MIGKKNIVFGFIYLCFTAALGPYMIQTVFPDLEVAAGAKQERLAALQLMASNDFEEELEPLSGAEIAKRNTQSLLALNRQLQVEGIKNSIKGGAHAHGNLEALLNIVVGLCLGFIALGALFKQILSWLFILGTLLHSGMLYLGIIFEQGWAMTVLGTGIGPILILVGLLAMGIVAAVGFVGRVVTDG